MQCLIASCYTKEDSVAKEQVQKIKKRKETGEKGKNNRGVKGRRRVLTSFASMERNTLFSKRKKYERT